MFPFELVIELLVLVMLRYRILIFMVMTRLSHLIYLPKVPLILMVKCTFDLIVLKKIFDISETGGQNFLSKKSPDANFFEKNSRK